MRAFSQYASNINMYAFLEEIEATLNCGIWSPALASVLVVPDACGAIEFPDQRNGERYKSWYDANVEPFIFTQLSSGELVWKIRNAMIHEAGIQFTAFGFDRVLFTVPDKSGNVFDQNTSRPTQDSPLTLNLDLLLFVRRILHGAEQWLSSIRDDVAKQGRLDRLLQLRPNGLAPHMVGMPLIA